MKAYRGMKPKQEGVLRRGLLKRNVQFYGHWDKIDKSYLTECGWEEITSGYVDTIQYDLLRALTVTGLKGWDWGHVFRYFHPRTGEGAIRLNRYWIEHQTVPDWKWFVFVITARDDYNTFYPSTFPTWLIEYGYTQREFIADLKEYWDNIAGDYYQPWLMTRIGVDSLATEALKQIGQEAREQMNQLVGAISELVQEEL